MGQLLHKEKNLKVKQKQNVLFRSWVKDGKQQISSQSGMKKVTLISSARAVFSTKSSARELISTIYLARALPLHSFWRPHYMRQSKMAASCHTL